MATAPKMFGKKKASKPKPRNDRRESAHKRGYDRRWYKLRNAYINEHPLCEHCERRGEITPATEIDHIKPFDGLNDQLRLDPSNLQALCRSCHAAKTWKDKR